MLEKIKYFCKGVLWACVQLTTRILLLIFAFLMMWITAALVVFTAYKGLMLLWSLMKFFEHCF